MPTRPALNEVDELLRLLDGLERRSMVPATVTYGDIEVRLLPARSTALAPAALAPDVTAAAPGSPRTYLGQKLQELSARRAERTKLPSDSDS